MSASQDGDSQQRFALGFLFALIALVVFSTVGWAVYRFGVAHAPAAPAALAALAAPAAPAAPVAAASTTPRPPAAPAGQPPQPAVAVVTETVAVVIPEGASIQVANGVVSFYFATGSADLAPGAAEALAAVIKGVEGRRKAVVSGFHDTTGDAAINEALARQRAQTVQQVLVGLGVPAARIELRKPEVTTGSGSNAQARRVEVTLVD